MTKAGDRIREGALDALAFARGEDTGAIVHQPANVPDEVDIKALREKLDLSQTGFAREFGFTPAAIRNWEQGSRKPGLTTRAFLTVIERNPDAVREALSR
ncbi:MAG: helix-turn-helix domain-containing protein [Alphaproteobacteria bacterium]|jgi:putative transcriptional regulator|nr:helix-turn-helix domain-containing protein [Alphaproteobacteria bacterium]MDP6814933.1 helix-turn-helix domain-containing protein [Alphaproteobacteria bacterium]|tara:strand:+ start:209 stop:508 length:300 start_codon:yes stop_codon:yes gene_type:complete